MAYILYSCPDEFPAKIPAILSNLASPAICRQKQSLNDREFDSPFHYDVERGRGRISIFGSREGGIVNLAIVSGSINPLGWRASAKLDEEVRSALIQAGLAEMTIAEILHAEAMMEEKKQNKSEMATPRKPSDQF
ncbi:MAG: hypothetical protein ACKVHP_16795 [Verrucomicrobiales bacterium]|jgi:hypothetical protein